MVYDGKGLITRALMLYNTGSNILLLFEKDLVEMAIPETLAQY